MTNGFGQRSPPGFLLMYVPCGNFSKIKLDGKDADSVVMQARVLLEIRSGVIISSKICISEQPEIAEVEQQLFDFALKNYKVIKIASFWDVLGKIESLSGRIREIRRISAWLDLMLGKDSDFDPH